MSSRDAARSVRQHTLTRLFSDARPPHRLVECFAFCGVLRTLHAASLLLGVCYAVSFPFSLFTFPFVSSTPSVASLLVPPVSGGQFAGAVLTVVTGSLPFCEGWGGSSCQVQYLLHAGAFILYAKSFGGVRASELAQTEVI